MMNNSYKKDILKNIIGSKGVVLGNPAASSTVKFQFATSIATAAGSNTPGALTFAADASGNAAIYAQGTLVSSKIQNVVAANKSGAKHGAKTVTVTYIGAAGAIETATFDVIDEAALEAYFANSKTIALDAETNRYEVKTKANGGIAVDTEGAGLYAVLSDIFGVDGNTIGFKSDNKTIESLIKIVYIDGQSEGNTGNDRIALTDKNGVELTHVDVQDIIGGGIVSNVVYNPDNNSLTIYWIGGATTTIDLSKLFDISDWAVETGSENFLDLAIDASTAKIGVKKADVTYTESSDNNPANLTVDTTNGEILVASDAIPAIKNYVDAQSADLAVEAASRNSYIDSSVIASENNKKVWVAAQVAELTITKEDEADTTITGIAGKLVDASDTAAKVQSFVNARISEEISKLDGSIVFNDGNYISAGFKEVDGKLNGVWVNNTYGAFGTPTHNGTAISATAATDGIAKAENVQAFVIDAIKVLDTSLNATTTDISIYLEQVDGKVTSIGLEHSVANVTFTAKDGNTPANLTGTGSFVMASDIEAIRNYVDAVAAAGFDDLDSQVVEKDNDELVTVTTGIVNGKLFDASCSVALTRGALDASFGTITATTDGLITAREMADSVTTALKWHIL